MFQFWWFVVFGLSATSHRFSAWFILLMVLTNPDLLFLGLFVGWFCLSSQRPDSFLLGFVLMVSTKGVLAPKLFQGPAS